MDVKAKAINQAVRLLQAAGAQFKVIAEDGAEFGELQVAEPKTRTRRHNVYAATGYIQKLEQLEVGGTLVLVAPAGEPIKGFHSAVSGAAGRIFGNGNYLSVRTDNDTAVEVLRVA